MENKYNTIANRIKSKAEIIPNKSKVDITGSISNSVRIKQLINTGKRLEAHRADNYDFNYTDIDLNTEIEDITRIKGVDLVDVMKAKERLIQKIKEKKQERFKALNEQQQAEYKKMLKADIIKELEMEKLNQENKKEIKKESKPSSE